MEHRNVIAIYSKVYRNLTKLFAETTDAASGLYI